MQESVSPRKIQLVVKKGFDRMQNYRRASAMFVKEFAGHYYRQEKGLTGEEPINLIFHTIRTMVPNLVMKNPVNKIITPYIPHKEYAELLGLGVTEVEKQIKLKQTLRAWITSAFFGWGIIKVALAAKGQMIKFGDVDVDPGQVYAELVDLDDFVIDPICKVWSQSMFFGHRTTVPRQLLLDVDLYDHDGVIELPSSKAISSQDTVASLTQQTSGTEEMRSLQDFVDVVELYVPEADALITIPDPAQKRTEKYLGITDYYGPKDGPYIDLSFTPPVRNNPLPIPPVSVIYDLHRMANRTFKKVMNQADAQKDVLLYNPINADMAQDIVDAKDGDVIASPNPKDAMMYSYGGQNRDNVQMLQQLHIWFNYLAGNPDQMAGNVTPGTKGTKTTATLSSILQSNASVSIEDARDILYDRTAEISKRIAWYLHTDPLIDQTLMKRTSGNKEIQLRLTPEQRRGNFLEFTFNIVERSMSRLDPTIRSKRIMEFGTNILPAAANTAMIMMQIGRPFNLEAYLTRMADELGIFEDVQDFFHDPQFQERLQLYMAMGPQNQGKAGGDSANTQEGVVQNQGFPMKRNIPGAAEIANQTAQAGAAEGQAAIQGAW